MSLNLQPNEYFREIGCPKHHPGGMNARGVITDKFIFCTEDVRCPSHFSTMCSLDFKKGIRSHGQCVVALPINCSDAQIVCQKVRHQHEGRAAFLGSVFGGFQKTIWPKRRKALHCRQFSTTRAEIGRITVAHVSFHLTSSVRRNGEEISISLGF